jgi:hypothetical protein
MYVIAAHAAPAGEGVSQHDSEHVADVGGAVDVEYGGRDEHAPLGLCMLLLPAHQGALHQLC